MVLVCRLILEDHVMKLSLSLMDKSPSSQVTTLESLEVIATLVVQIILVCYVILQDYMMKQ